MYCVLRLAPLALALMGGLSAAYADNCPPKYRFVEFGRLGPDGVIRKGGPIFRAVDFTNTSIIQPAGTNCRAVTPLAVDGHAQPVPIITRVIYDAPALAAGVSALQLDALSDIAAQAEQNAAQHRKNLTTANVKTAKGDDFLCAHVPGTETTSCQIVSPYGDNQTVVAYCTAAHCKMSYLEVGPGINAQARWPNPHKTTEAIGRAASRHLKRLKDLLEELS